MMTFLIIAIYIVGVLLSLGRHMAIDYEFHEFNQRLLTNRARLKPCYKNFFDSWDLLLHALSWVTFFVLTIIYFQEHNKYFLKFNYKGLKLK